MMLYRFLDCAGVFLMGAGFTIVALKLIPSFADFTQDQHVAWFMLLAVVGAVGSTAAYVMQPYEYREPKADYEAMAAGQAEATFASKMREAGWFTVWHSPFAPLALSHPSEHELVQLMREEWEEPQIANWNEDIGPQANVAGLWWRPYKQEKPLYPT